MRKDIERIVAKTVLLCIFAFVVIFGVLEVDQKIKGVIYQTIIMDADDPNKDIYMQITQIIMNVFSTILVTTLSFYGATYIYRNQKKDEIIQLEDEMHLLLKELGVEYRRIKALAKSITDFNQKSKENGNNRGHLGSLVDLWMAFSNFEREEWFENYKKYSFILAKRQKITLRTGEQVKLSDLEMEIQEIQWKIKQQYYEMISLKEKMNTIGYFFEEENQNLYCGEEDIENSAIRRIERTLRNEGMNTDYVLDDDLKILKFKYEESNQIVKQLILFEKNTQKLSDTIEKCTIVTKSTIDRYFISSDEAVR